MWAVQSLYRRLAHQGQRKTRSRRQIIAFESLEQRRLLTIGLSVSGPQGDLCEAGSEAVFTISGGTTGEESATVEYRAISASAEGGDDFEAVTGVLTFTPGNSVHTVTVPIVDDLLAEDDEDFYLELSNAVNAVIEVAQAGATIRVNDHAPSIDAIGDRDVDEETELLFSIHASDPDAPEQTLTYSLESAPAGATIDAQTGQFSWTPDESDGSGVFEVTVCVTDDGSLSSTQSFSITVNEVNLAPTTGVLSDVSVDEDAEDTVIELWPSFDDAEDGANGLSYSIASNSNSDLFAGASIDSSGRLHLDYAENAFGDAALTIRATDSGGLSVDSTLIVHVASVNDVPVMIGLALTPGDIGWLISGSVWDDDPSGCTVYFGGVLAGYSISVTPNADGTFSMIVSLPDLQSGKATAWVVDAANVQSDSIDCAV